MKKFEISAYGVEEMKCQELVCVDGGRFRGALRGIRYVMEAIGYYDFIADVRAGWEYQKSLE